MRFGLNVKRIEGWTPHSLAPLLWLALSGSLAVALPACEEEHTLEPTVNARPGVVQGSADGPQLDEDEACEQLRGALLDAVESNSCDEVAVADCPELIRPAGSLACVRYAQASVEECVEAIGGFDSCDAFVGDACIVVAVVGSETQGCVPPGPGDGGAAEDGGSSATTEDPTTSSTTAGMDTTTGGSDVLDGGGTSSVVDVDAGDEPVVDASAPEDASVPPLDPAPDAGETATEPVSTVTGEPVTSSDPTQSDAAVPQPSLDAGADSGL